MDPFPFREYLISNASVLPKGQLAICFTSVKPTWLWCYTQTLTSLKFGLKPVLFLYVLDSLILCTALKIHYYIWDDLLLHCICIETKTFWSTFLYFLCFEMHVAFCNALFWTASLRSEAALTPILLPKVILWDQLLPLFKWMEVLRCKSECISYSLSILSLLLPNMFCIKNNIGTLKPQNHASYCPSCNWCIVIWQPFIF